MKKLLLLCPFLFALLNLVFAAENPAAPGASAPSPYASFDFLIGGVWRATLPPGKDGVALQIEAEFAVPENRQGVSFHSTFIRGEKRSPYTHGLYAWNGAKGKLVFFYTDSQGSLTEGTIAQEGNVLAHDFTITDKAGKVERARSRLTKLGPDAFTNEISVLRDEAWTKVVDIRYERQR